MQEINNYIKENDTDNVIMKNIDDIIYDIVDDDYSYESSYGTSETTPEALEKLKMAISNKILNKGFKLMKISINGYEQTCFVYNAVMLITNFVCSVNDITSNSVINGRVKIGTIDLYDNSTKFLNANGALPCVYYGSDNVYHCGVIQLESDYSSQITNMYLVPSDTTIFTSTPQKLSVRFSGSCYHYTPSK